MASHGKTRAMEPTDIPEVARIFMKVFRESEAPASEELKTYMTDLLFGSPNYSPETGSQVFEDEDGRINGALNVVPLSFTVGDRPQTARMLCGFMVEDTKKRGGAELSIGFRARNQDFAFSETAKPMSADLVNALGGMTLVVQSLEWVRIFRPAGLVAALIARRGGWMARLPFGAPARLLDRFLARLVPQIPDFPLDLKPVPVEEDEFIALVPDYVRQYEIRPSWTEPELRFILAMARRKVKNGPLSLLKFVDGKDRILGLMAYYGRSGGIAAVLNIFSAKGKENQVLPVAMKALADAGCVAARGMCQPRQIDWHYRDRGVFFRHNAYFVATTRLPDVKDAMMRNDIYIGGLAGETWNRMVSDHF